MREVSRRWKAMVPGPNHWQNEIYWSNDGGHHWTPATYLGGGKVKSDSTSQVRWSCTLRILGPDLGRGGLNPFTTRIRVMHGMAGEPLLPMGHYKVTKASWDSDWPDAINVEGLSYEVYLQRARFLTARTFPAQPASQLVATLIREVLPDAQITWRDGVDGALRLPSIQEKRDRWALIDGSRDSGQSIARALGARVYASPAGGWIVAPVPSLQDAPVWEASEGAGGVLLSHGEELSDEDVRNVIVASGVSSDGDTPTFAPGVAADNDPLSLTYVGKSPDEGGFGPVPRFYASPLLRSTQQAQTVAEGMLAPYLGLKQQISFTQLHDPSRETGDAGVVRSRKGDRAALLDSLDYDLDGGPMSGQTRTTATRLAGSQLDAPAGSADQEDAA